MTIRKGDVPVSATFELGESLVAGSLVLRSIDGAAITDDRRNALLEAVRAGQHVEIDLDIMPFRQRRGERNRNSVRFREGALRALGRSGKGMPFLRDHDQGSSDAVGGYITASRCEPEVADDAAAEWRLHQTVRLTAPWAVEMALRGLFRFFSIGWQPTGPIHCSICDADYFGPDCRHWRGQRLEDGRVVELEYQDAELVETSAVPVPAVKGTSVESIRAALSARGEHRGMGPHEDDMNLLSKLIPILGLAATATESEALQAVQDLATGAELAASKLRAATEQRDEVRRQLESTQGELAQLQAAHGQRLEDDFIAEAIRLRKLRPEGDSFEQTLRDWFRRDPKAAAELRDARADVTPVGLPRQSAKPAAPDAPPRLAAAADVIHQRGASLDAVRNVLKLVNPTANPDELLTKHVAPQEA